MNFINLELKLFKQESLLDKLKISILCFFPIFLIIGTAISEIGVITLCIVFILEFFFKKENIFNNKLTYFFLCLYLCLLINLIFSLNVSNSILRNLFFLKYIIFVLGLINFLPKKKYRFGLIFKSWLMIIFVFSLDLFVQLLFGTNIIGIESPHRYHRTSGFMGEELKAGSLILAVSFISSCFIISNTKYKNIGLALLIFFLLSIFISGDRSNFIKSLMVLIYLFLFLKKEDIKRLIPWIGGLVLIVATVLNNYPPFKERYINKIFQDLSSNNFNVIKFIDNTEYGKIYSTSIKVFEKFKVFGIGNKNFRMICDDDFKKNFALENEIDEKQLRCNTHPHQIYLEILSEHGMFGFIFLFIFLFLFLKSNLKKLLKKKNLLLNCLFITLLINFIPIIPSGSFFTSFNATLFWINFSLFYSYKKIIN